jgi:2-keto-4-pentenoate hydratase/2-oxohepta-3-ene-1,7-dioic acid hydratase in catechol pathway
MTAILLLLAAAPGAAAAATATATRIVRFVDTAGAIRTGHATSDELHRLSQGAAKVTVAVCCVGQDGSGQLYDDRSLTGERVTVQKLLAPIPKPPAIIGIGLNYRNHAKQANLTLPEHPAVFFKGRNTFNHPLHAVEVPPQSSLPDFEGELAFVFGKDCKDVPISDALGCILGFTAANDVSARCWQSDTSDGQRCLAGDQSYHPLHATPPSNPDGHCHFALLPPPPHPPTEPSI